MERVALLLQITAIKRRASAAELDLFGRSAYNRYYYAMFLLVREMLTRMNPVWSDNAHAAIPELLVGTVIAKLKQASKRARRIGDNESVDLCSQGVAAAISLADLMKVGYASRVVADYNPEIPIVLSSGDRFTLNTVSINDAHDWPDRARRFTRIILRVWELDK